MRGQESPVYKGNSSADHKFSIYIIIYAYVSLLGMTHI